MKFTASLGVLVFASSLVVACSSSSSTGNTTPDGGGSGSSSSGSNGSSGSAGATGFGCNLSVAGTQYCYVYSNLTADQVSAEKNACSQQNGSVVTSCPSANVVGCCKVTTAGIQVNECYYSGTADNDKQACTAANGTWSTSM